MTLGLRSRYLVAAWVLTSAPARAAAPAYIDRIGDTELTAAVALVSGDVLVEGLGNTDIAFVQVDAGGHLVGVTSQDGAIGAGRMFQLPGGDVLLAGPGAVDVNYPACFLARTDARGALLAPAELVTDDDDFHDAAVNGSGDIAITSSQHVHFGPYRGLPRVTLIHPGGASAGQIELSWGTDVDRVAVVAASGDDFLVALGVDGGAGDYVLRLLRIDRLGALLWMRDYAVLRYAAPAGIAATADGGVVVVGYASSPPSIARGFVLKLSGSGSVDWAVTTPWPIDHQATGVVSMASGVIAVLEAENFFAVDDPRTWVLGLGLDGAPLWLEEHPLVDELQPAPAPADGGLLLIGRRYPGAGDFLLIKTDERGQVPGCTQTLVPLVEPLVVADWPPGFAVRVEPAPAGAPLPVAPGATVPSVTTVCSGCAPSGPVTGLRAVKAAGDVAFAWDPAAVAGFNVWATGDAYEIPNLRLGSGSGVCLGVPGTTCTDTGGPRGYSVFYQVRAACDAVTEGP